MNTTLSSQRLQYFGRYTHYSGSYLDDTYHLPKFFSHLPLRHYLAPESLPIYHPVKQRQQSTSSKSWCLKNELVEIGRLRKLRREII